MRPTLSFAATVTLAGTLASAVALPASAACTRLGASVNDFGKDGPTQDAKVLLDKYIAKWATDHGVAKYKTGTKEVKCELFLNVIVFDEHTCRAEATVCWDGPPVTPAVTTAAKDGAEKPGGVPGAAPAMKRAVVRVAPEAVGDGAASVSVETVKTPVGSPITEVPTVAATPAPVAQSSVAAPKPAPKVMPKPATVSDSAVASQAMAAAEKAAAAAERAAAAAERAAASAVAAERASAPIAASAKP